jgi:lysophospholipase
MAGDATQQYRRCSARSPGQVQHQQFDAQTYINNNAKNASALPNIGLAVSGGGYRALMNGAGVLAAFDSRTDNSTSSGHLGGLLQASTYLAGLSGGAWLVGSFVNNFTTVPALLDDNTSTVWEFGSSIFQGPAKNGIQTLSTAEYYSNISDTVQAKAMPDSTRRSRTIGQSLAGFVC